MDSVMGIRGLKTFDTEKAIEVVLYLAKNAPEPDIYHILKIIYFSDRKHLERYGRLLYGDCYVAMRHGPVPSTTYDIIKYVRGDGFFSFSDHARKSFEVNGEKVSPLRKPYLDLLSESDIECLNEAIKEYGNLSFPELRRLSHDAAYKSAKENDVISIENIAKSLQDGDLLIKHLNDF